MYPDKIPKLLLGASQIICPENWDNEDSSSPIEFVTSRHCFTFRFVSLSRNTLQTIYPKPSFSHQCIKFYIKTPNLLSPTNVLNSALKPQTIFLPLIYYILHWNHKPSFSHHCVKFCIKTQIFLLPPIN